MRTRVSWICALVPLAIWSAALAAAPPLLPLQGVLTDADGVPLTAAVALRFSLHTAETGGTEVWYETQSVTPVDGLFAAYLGQGSGQAMTLATFRDEGQLWLEVKVGEDDPMPRVRLASVAWAGYAEYCGNVPTHSHASGDLPAGVVIGAQSCGGSDKVRGIASSGAIVCAPDLGTGADTLSQLSCTPGQTVKWNGSVWGCAADSDAVTAVSAGGGLTADTVGTVVALSLTSCGAAEVRRFDGSAWQCSPAVMAITTPGTGGLAFTTTGATYNLTLKAGCANGQVLKWNGGTSSWDCATDASSGGDVTDVLAAAQGGLSVANSGGPQPSLGLKACTATGEVLKYTVGSGWDCAADDVGSGDITAVETAAGSGLEGGASSGTVSLQLRTCGAGQTLRSSGSSWGCADSLAAVNTPSTGGLVGGGATGSLSLALKPCTGGQVLKSVGGGAWDCGPDTSNAGTVTSVETGAGLTGGPITSSGSIAIAPAGVTNAMLANPGLTVTAGTGLAGGGTVALGDSVTLAIPDAGITNAMLAQSGVTVTAGTGLTGGGAVSLGGAVTVAVDFGTSNGSENAAARADHTHASTSWSLGGNAGTDPTTDYLGTSDAQPLELRVDGARALRLEPTATVPNVIGGSQANAATAGVIAATIGGGGTLVTGNLVTDNFGTVGGGAYNQAGNDSGSFGDSEGATVGGGYSNTASGMHSVVAGGYANSAGLWAAVGGGSNNGAYGIGGTVAGGQLNSAGGSYAAVPGGTKNWAAGDYSFAAGRRAKTNAAGCFVWGDSTDADVACSTANQFLARASGGTTFYSSADLSTGVTLAAGGGSWSSVSDRNLKQDVAPVDSRAVLAKVAAMPVSTWRYKTEVSGARHMGPMAQDFHGAFGLGGSDRSITTVDADGVALAAIQGLDQVDGELRAENTRLRGQIRSLESRVAELDGLAARVRQLEQARPASGGPGTLGWGAFGVLVAGGLVVARRRRGR